MSLLEYNEFVSTVFWKALKYALVSTPTVLDFKTQNKKRIDTIPQNSIAFVAFPFINSEKNEHPAKQSDISI